MTPGGSCGTCGGQGRVFETRNGSSTRVTCELVRRDGMAMNAHDTAKARAVVEKYGRISPILAEQITRLAHALDVERATTVDVTAMLSATEADRDRQRRRADSNLRTVVALETSTANLRATIESLNRQMRALAENAEVGRSARDTPSKEAGR